MVSTDLKVTSGGFRPEEDTDSHADCGRRSGAGEGRRASVRMDYCGTAGAFVADDRLLFVTLSQAGLRQVRVDLRLK